MIAQIIVQNKGMPLPKTIHVFNLWIKVVYHCKKDRENIGLTMVTLTTAVLSHVQLVQHFKNNCIKERGIIIGDTSNRRGFLSL